jgi:hypothetical protein
MRGAAGHLLFLLGLWLLLACGWGEGEGERNPDSWPEFELPEIEDEDGQDLRLEKIRHQYAARNPTVDPRDATTVRDRLTW